MGLLDDAIREHLDLKRRRGADPTEIERAEREALGPVRRTPEEREMPDPGLDEAGDYPQNSEAEWHDDGDDHIPTGVVEPERQAQELPTEGSVHDPFADDPFAEDPLADDAGVAAREPEPFGHEPDDDPGQPEPLALEEPPRRRGFLGRRKQAQSEREPDEQPDHEARAGAEDTGGETVEYEVEAALEAERKAEREDVLEETPEFLHDTPDHDRLWFEQRPPRDFDFDG
jgi:hypothetical protein